MKASAVLVSLLSSLEPVAAAQDRGKVILAEDPLHVLELLSAGPGGWGVVLLDKGETAEAKGPVSILRMNFACYVWQARGLSARSGAHIPGLTARCELVRDTVHAMRFAAATTAQVPQYENRTPVAMPDGFPLGAYELNFFLRISGT